MLGINQYRQRLPGEPLFNAGSGQVAPNALAVSSGEMSHPKSGSTVSPGERLGANEIVSSLAVLRETLQVEPTADQAAPAQADHGLAKMPAVGSTETRQSRSLEALEKSPALVIPQATHIPQAAQSDASGKISEQNQDLSVEQENISFSLACWQVNDEVLVINGFALGERVNRTQLELLANMLRAIGQLPSSLPAAELIEWPLSPGAESTLAGAKTQLSMFLLGRQQVRPYRCLLAMGDEPVRLLAKNEAASALEPSSEDTIFIPSLQTMLAEPICKREVWQTLRHLRGT